MLHTFQQTLAIFLESRRVDKKQFAVLYPVLLCIVFLGVKLEGFVLHLHHRYRVLRGQHHLFSVSTGPWGGGDEIQCY